MTASENSVKLSKDKQRMLRGSILMTLSPVSALFLGIVISLLIDAYIPPQNYAIYQWFNVFYTLFGALIIFRLPTALQYRIASAKGSDHTEELQKLMKTNTILALILTPLSGIISFLAIPVLLDLFLLSGQYFMVDVLICALGIMALTLSTFAVSAYKGLQEFEVVGIGQFVSNLIGQLAVIILIVVGVGYLGIVSLGVQALLYKWIVVGVLTTMILTVAVRKSWTLKGSTYPFKPLVKFAAPLITSFIFVFIFSELLVMLFLNPFQEELGLYGFAVRIANFVNALTLGFYGALSSFYAQSYGKGDCENLEKDVGWTMKISVFLFLPMVIGAMIISPAIFLILFPNYYWAYQYFIILLFKVILFLFRKPYLDIINVRGKSNLVLIIQVIASMLSGVLMFLAFSFGPLIMAYGLIDNALLLVVLAYILNNLFISIFAAIVIKRDIGIKLGIRGVLPLLLIGFLIIPTAMIIHFLYLPPLLELAIIIPLGVIIYLLPIRYLRIISEKEIRKASQFLPRRFASSFASIIVRLFVRNSDN
ncbi:MAG: MATE family efflux transporter [Promethearchaeota archaeon]